MDGDFRLSMLAAKARPSSRTVPIDAEKLRRLRERTLILTQGEFAERLKLSLSAYQNLESGRTKSVYIRTLRKIAEVADLPFDQIEMAVRREVPWDNNVEPYSEQAVPRIPSFDVAVAAGNWVDVPEAMQVCDPRQIDHGLFRIRLRGDSMSPRFKDGETIEFRCLRDGRDALEVGASYYVQRDGEATFKQLAEIGEDVLVFHAINRKKYPDPMPVDRRSIMRMAKAVGHFKPVD